MTELLPSLHPTAQLAVVLTLLTSVYLLLRRLKLHLEKRKPFPDLPMPTDTHFLFGHMHHFRKPFQDFFQVVAADFANEYGHTGK